MTYNKIGFHIAANCGGCDGIDAMWRQLDNAGTPFTVYSANDSDKIVTASVYRNATLVYRDVEASTVNPADYTRDPRIMADIYWKRTVERLPQSIKNIRNRCWIELLNEPGKDEGQANWVGALMYHMALFALAEGYRVMGPGWSPGTPEPEHWQTDEWLEYIRLCNRNPNRVALSVHEYSLSDDITHGSPWHIGRFLQIYIACGQAGLAVPQIFITECGWTLNSMPDDEQAKEDIMFLDSWYGDYPEVQCAMLWTLQSGKGNGNLPQRLNGLMPWLTQYSLERYEPDDDTPTEPPPVKPPPTMKNLLNNPSFENGWTNATEFSGQYPDGWQLVWTTGTNQVVPDQPYRTGEAVHKSRNELPPHEWNQFILDGQWTYKVFGDGPKPIWFRLKQEINLPAGKYQLVLPVVVDCYRGRADSKDFDLEPNHAQAMVKANERVIRDWFNLTPGTTPESVIAVIDHAGGTLDLAVHFRANWGTSNNFWLDDWSLVAMTTTPPPEPEPEPEPMTRDEALWQAAHSVAPVNYDAALQKAVLASGNYVPYGPEKWTVYEGQQYATQAAIDWDNRRKRTYWCYVPRWSEVFYIDEPGTSIEFANWPVKAVPYITQPFGARPEVYSQYGLPGHEGVDMRATLDTPILAVAEGVVTLPPSAENYGTAVRLSHASGWYTLYAHLNRKANLPVGTVVKAGQEIGYAGTTGNSTGVHLHFGLSHESMTYTDTAGNRWPKGIHDPTPQLQPFLVQTGTDLLPYLKGSGVIYQMTVMWQNNQYSQQMQTQIGDNRFYQVKNNEWEELFADGDFIFRGIDTSPGENMYYWQRENMLADKARWCPRRMNVGDIYERNPLVTFYYKDNGQQVYAPGYESGYKRTWLKFAAHHNQWKSPHGGITFSQVAELHWLTKPTNPPAEIYFYAKDYGLVGWQSWNGDYSHTVEVFRPGERTAMAREKIVVR